MTTKRQGMKLIVTLHFLFRNLVLVLLLWGIPHPSSAADIIDNNNPNDPSLLFSIDTSTFAVLGPTKFPKPTDIYRQLNNNNETILPILQPTFGTHRPDQDAVFAYAEGYELAHYLHFIETLRQTGFTGDVVLAVSSLQDLQEGVQEYFEAQQHIVVYCMDFLDCSSDNFQTHTARKQDNGGMMSFQMCKLHGIYGYHNTTTSSNVVLLPDVRLGRVVATSRYELYWIWALHYDPNVWIMLLDARDAYFQQDPFQRLPKSPKQGKKDGILYFYGENTNATRLGKSPKNRKWLERGYSKHVQQVLADKPTICSGSTMGEQIAMEMYLRAMVNEWDETHVHMKGSDQGFHNYLYYTNKLANAEAIRKIVVWDQGRGVINNVGAMRIIPLSEWGMMNNKTFEVYNWDGSLSPVVHQWDRDSALSHEIGEIRFRELRQQWKLRSQQQ